MTDMATMARQLFPWVYEKTMDHADLHDRSIDRQRKFQGARQLIQTWYLQTGPKGVGLVQGAKFIELYREVPYVRLFGLSKGIERKTVARLALGRIGLVTTFQHHKPLDELSAATLAAGVVALAQNIDVIPL